MATRFIDINAGLNEIENIHSNTDDTEEQLLYEAVQEVKNSRDVMIEVGISDSEFEHDLRKAINLYMEYYEKCGFVYKM